MRSNQTTDGSAMVAWQGKGGQVRKRITSCNLLHLTLAYKSYVKVLFCLCESLFKAFKMTTFARIGGDETPSINVDVTRGLSKIDPNIHGPLVYGTSAISIFEGCQFASSRM